MIGNSPQRILALDLHPRRFGFVVFEGEKDLLDWGVKSSRRGVNAVRTPMTKRLAGLMEQFQPSAVILRRPGNSAGRKGGQSGAMLHRVQKLLQSYRIPLRFLNDGAIKKCFAEGGATKYAIARDLATRYPELALHLPPERKLWQSEDYRMSIFDAAALAVTYSASKDNSIDFG